MVGLPKWQDIKVRFDTTLQNAKDSLNNLAKKPGKAKDAFGNTFKTRDYSARYAYTDAQIKALESTTSPEIQRQAEALTQEIMQKAMDSDFRMKASPERKAAIERSLYGLLLNREVTLEVDSKKQSIRKEPLVQFLTKSTPGEDVVTTLAREALKSKLVNALASEVSNGLQGSRPLGETLNAMRQVTNHKVKGHREALGEYKEMTQHPVLTPDDYRRQAKKYGFDQPVVPASKQSLFSTKHAASQPKQLTPEAYKKMYEEIGFKKGDSFADREKFRQTLSALTSDVKGRS